MIINLFYIAYCLVFQVFVFFINFIYSLEEGIFEILSPPDRVLAADARAWHAITATAPDTVVLFPSLLRTLLFGFAKATLRAWDLGMQTNQLNRLSLPKTN